MTTLPGNSADATLTLQNKDGTSYNRRTQASVTVVDYSTGQLTAMVGGHYPYVMKAATVPGKPTCRGFFHKTLAVYARR